MHFGRFLVRMYHHVDSISLRCCSSTDSSCTTFVTLTQAVVVGPTTFELHVGSFFSSSSSSEAV